MEILYWMSLLVSLLVSVGLIELVVWQNVKDPLLTAGIAFLVTLLLICGISIGAHYGQTTDTELWTGYAQEVKYREEWTETRVVTTTDAKGNMSTHVETIYHPPEWWLVDSNGLDVGIHSSQYETLAERWGHSPRRHGSSGTLHRYGWNGDPRTAEVVATTHHFENRIRANKHNTFRKEPLTLEERNGQPLHARQWISANYYAPSVYGDPFGGELEKRIAKINADLGASKQVRIHLLFYQDVDIAIGPLQERDWEGGKKNELNLCLGLHGNTIVWCYPFSWSEREDMKAELRDELEGLHEAQPIAAAIEKTVREKWERKHFRDFKYLAIDTPLWAVLLAYFVAVAIPITVFLTVNHQLVPTTRRRL